MNADTDSQRQALAGLEQLLSLLRAQSFRDDDTPALAPTQAAVLRMLAEAPGGLRASQMAPRLGVSAASLSDSLKALEAREWIRRQPDPDDARATRVRLARAGKRAAAALNDPLRGFGRLLQGLQSHDIGALLRVVQLLVRQAQLQGLASGHRTCLGCRYFQPYSSGRADQPHFCGYVQQPFGDAQLRADCAEQEPADEALAQTNALRFAAAPNNVKPKAASKPNPP